MYISLLYHNALMKPIVDFFASVLSAFLLIPLVVSQLVYFVFLLSFSIITLFATCNTVAPDVVLSPTIIPSNSVPLHIYSRTSHC